MYRRLLHTSKYVALRAMRALRKILRKYLALIALRYAGNRPKLHFFVSTFLSTIFDVGDLFTGTDFW